jgi:para-nitrobenzyl esterase
MVEMKYIKAVIFRGFMFLIGFLCLGVTNLLAESEFSSSRCVFQKANEVKVISNIQYGNNPEGINIDSSSCRTLDLYLPEDHEEELPVLVFIHGGGFRGGDKKSTEEFCKKISEYGFAVVSINYYLFLKHEKTENISCSAFMAKGIPEAGFHPLLRKAIKSASEDTQEALKWIKNHSRDYHFDLTSIALSGGSAGAMTALYTAYISNQEILTVGAVVNL